MDRAKRPPSSLARRQAVLATVAILASSLVVGVTLYLAAAGALRDEIARGFRTLAHERQRQIEMYVQSQARVVSQITSRTRLRQILGELGTNEVIDGNSSLALAGSRILKDSVAASDAFRNIDILDSSGRVLASSQSDRIGEVGQLPQAADDDVNKVTVTGLCQNGHVSPTATFLAPVQLEETRGTTAVVVFDASELAALIADTDELGSTAMTFVVRSSHPDDLPSEIAAELTKSGGTGFEQVDIESVPHLAYWQPLHFSQIQSEPHYFVAMVEATEAFAPLARQRSLLIRVALVVTALNALIAFVAATKTERHLRQLAQTALALGHSDDRHSPSATLRPDLTSLTAAFQDASLRVKSSMDELRADADRERGHHEQLAAEIEIAQEIQSCLYPDAPLKTGSIEVVGTSIAAAKLCGDYLDYFENGRSVVFALGDVSGHGIGPALLMVEVRGVIRSLQWESIPLNVVSERLNQLLTTATPDHQFITLVVGRIDRDSGLLEYVGAGHHAFLCRRDGTIEELPSSNLPLGMVSDLKYETGRTQLNYGDLFLATSDGLEETLNHQDELFGKSRVLDLVVSQRADALDKLTSTLLTAVDTHGAGRAQSDDRTIMLMRRRTEDSDYGSTDVSSHNVTAIQ